VASKEDIDDFSVRQLGLQIRCHCERAPLSYPHIVCGRDGYAMDGYARSADDVFGNSCAPRDDEQLPVKLSCRSDL
jgi:hypothetical protein